MFSLLLTLSSCRHHSHIRRSYSVHHHSYTAECHQLYPNTKDEDEFPSAMCIALNGADVRQQPGSTYRKLGVVKYGTLILVEYANGDWWKIRFLNGYGYVKAQFFVIYGEISYKKSPVIRDGIDFRSGPGIGYAKIMTLQNGTQFTIIDGVLGWYKVELNGMKGYVPYEYTKLISYNAALPPGMLVKQADSRLNSNIRKYGNKFLCLCYLGGTTTIEGILSTYNLAVKNKWMNSMCDTASIKSMLPITKAYKYKYYTGNKARSYICEEGEKEILYLNKPGNANLNHYVVGNGHNSIEYDPCPDGILTYADCNQKYIFTYVV